MKMCRKIIFYLLLNLLLGNTFNLQAMKIYQNKQNKLPEFKWLSDEKSNDGIPYLNIRFPDGDQDDLAILRQTQAQTRTEQGTGSDDCVFEGHLRSESNVVVNITGGCSLSNTFKISFKSRRLPFTMFEVSDGKVEAVLEDLESDVQSSQVAMSKDNLYTCHSAQLPENGFLLKIQVFYDQSFKMKFEEMSERTIEVILKKTQPLFNLPSLTTKMKLELVGIEEISNNITANENDLNIMATKYIFANTTTDAFIFFADTQEDFELVDGISFSHGICSPNKKSKAIIVEWSNSLTNTAKIVAHEIGHQLGMKHDFHLKNGINYNRYDIAHKKCTSIKGIMDYTHNRAIWSSCSVQDFIDYYLKVLKESRNHKFCLTPLVGVWSDWELVGSCTASCGGGTQKLQRTCTTLDQALTCSGSSNMEIRCNTQVCPVVGVWSDWESIGSCTAFCGGGTQKLQRTCTTLDQALTCSGPSHMDIRCNTQVCPIDGNWGDWGPFSLCSLTCDEGNQTRERSCNNPTPSNDGKTCEGSSTQVMSCNNGKCQREGVWGNWTSVGKRCSVSCGGGFMVLERRCLTLDDGNPCIGSSQIKVDCNPDACPKDGRWGNWTSLGRCSVSCGGGKIVLDRKCLTLKDGIPCTGSSQTQIECNTDACPKVGVWSDWFSVGNCSLTCGSGTQPLKRTCLTLDEVTCSGPSEMKIKCNTNECPRPIYSKVMVALGYYNIADVEIIDLLSSQTVCKKPPNFPYGNYWASGGLGFGEKPFICGGDKYKSTCHRYEDGTWKISEYLKQGRSGLAMTKLHFQDGSKKLFVTGGYDTSQLNSSEVLTENFGWQFSVSLPVTIRHHCMVTVNSTSVIVIGGYQNSQTSGKSFFFNSERNIWTEGPTLKTTRYYHSCGSIIRNSQTQEKSLIAVGGYSGSSYLRSVEVLDLDSTAWRSGPEFPFAISQAALVEDPSGGVVLIGGYDVKGDLDTLYRLPHAGSGATWELMNQKLKMKRHLHTAFLIPDDVAACN